MVLPFLMIAKALKPMAKIKKGAWKAMGGAFKQIRKSVDPMKSFSKILEIVNVLMLPLTFVMTLLAQIILTALMPYISDLIVALEDLGIWIDWLTIKITGWVIQLEAMGVSWELIFSALNSQKTEFDLLIIVLNTLAAAFEWVNDTIGDLLTSIRDWKSLGGFDGGGDGGDDGNWYDPLVDYIIGGGGGGTSAPATMSSTNTNNTNNININLQGSVIDDRGKLVRDIVEEVVMRIG